MIRPKKNLHDGGTYVYPWHLDDIMQDHVILKLMEHPSFELIMSSNNTWRTTTPMTKTNWTRKDKEVYVA